MRVVSSGLVMIALVAAAGQVGAEITWTDRPDNPVDLPMPDGNRSYMPCVIWNPDLNLYEMWYEQASIALETYVTSKDGITWEDPTLCTGLYNGGGEIQSARISVLYNSSWSKKYKGYYFCRDSTSGGRGDHVRCVESDNGINWENDRDIFEGETGAGLPAGSPDGHAVLHDPENPVAPFLMYYFSSDNTIWYAKSEDGVAFEPWDIAYDEEGLQPVTVLKIGDGDYRMWAFRVYNVPGIQYLRSTDAITWTLVADPLEAVGDAGPAGSWNDQRNYHPTVVYDGNGRFRMWRSGRNEATATYRTGYATGVDPDLETSVDNWKQR